MKYRILLIALLFCVNSALAQTYSQTRTVCVTPTVDTGAYAPGDNVGGKLTFALALQPPKAEAGGAPAAPGGLLQNALLVDLGAEGKQVEFCVFNTDPSATTFTDQAALDVADADVFKLAGCATFADFTSFADNGVGQLKNLSLSISSPSTSIYGTLIAREAVTYDAAAAVTVCITTIQD